MDLDAIRRILELVQEHDLAELEIEHDGLKLKVRRGAATAQPPQPAQVAPAVHAPGGAVAALPPTVTASGVLEAPAVPSEEVELAVVTSPIVGTFYRSPEPEAPAFVEIGSMVKKGQVLCIIEAMKLMNEIDSEYDGEVVNVYVENGQPVQYGERLFAIRTA